MNGLLKSTYSKNTPATTPKPENDEVQIIKEITGTGKMFDAIIIDEETKPNSGQKRTTASTPGKDTPAKKKKSSGGNDDTDTMIIAELEKRHGRGGSSLNGTYEICQAIKSFDHMGGIEKQKLEALEMCLHLRHGTFFEEQGIIPSNGILLHGPRGTGKTMFAEAVANILNIPIVKVSCTKLISSMTGGSENNLREAFGAAQSLEACVLLLDQIDIIASNANKDKPGNIGRLASQLMSSLDLLGKSQFGQGCKEDSKLRGVIVIGTTHRIEDIDEGLRRAGRFDKELLINFPNDAAREEILKNLARSVNMENKEAVLGIVAKETPGYVGADLESLVRLACMVVFKRIFQSKEDRTTLDNEVKNVLNMLGTSLTEDQKKLFIVTKEDFDTARSQIKPSSIREGFATVPKVTWDDIGALSKVRAEINWSITYPINQPEIFRQFKMDAKATGVLLWGPPGCGKTLVAKAVANQSRLNFISVNGPELLNMYVGETERAVRLVFQRARNSAPCVIFFDEIDAIASTRSNTSNSSDARVVNQLLTEMDGVEGREGVYLVAATNRVDKIDPAILRPGRLERKVYVGIPELEEKIDILLKMSKNGTEPQIKDKDQTLRKICEMKKVENFSGADLSALLTQSSKIAIKEIMEGKMTECYLSERHFLEALQHMRASVTDKQMKLYFNQNIIHGESE